MGAGPLEQAKELALRALAARARSRAWLRRKLEAAGFGRAVVDEALRRLEELGVLDDAEYARTRAHRLLASGRLAPAAVVRRLEAEGVASALAERAAEEARGGTSDRRLAEGLLARQFPGLLSAQAPARERLRAARFLAGRGFSEELVRELLRLDDGSGGGGGGEPSGDV